MIKQTANKSKKQEELFDGRGAAVSTSNQSTHRFHKTVAVCFLVVVVVIFVAKSRVEAAAGRERARD